jgi:hypothetical protein
MRSVFTYKSPEEFEYEKSEFMTYYNYVKQTDPENYEDWFDKDILDLYVRGKRNPYFSSERKNPKNERVSTTRIPTRCPECSRPWAVECQDNGKFQENYLDESLYKNIPMVKGVCIECRG